MGEEGRIVANIAIIEPTYVRQEITVFVEVEMQSEFGATHDATRRLKCSNATTSPGEVDFISWSLFG